MRLDKYLKVSRLIKRRTIANEACDAGKIVINGIPAKASYNVKLDDIFDSKLCARTTQVKVTSINEYANKETAADTYQVLED